jgi:hypothetical protein
MRTLLLLSVMACSGTGCVHLQPIGPMAAALGKPQPMKRTAEGARVTELGPNKAVVPLMRPALPPPPPAMLVTPAEVSEANHQQAARRLLDEMEADRKSLDSMPRYSEVSVVRNR